MDNQQKDERFASIDKDPRFQTVPKKEKKIAIDKRFKSMFSDERFKLKYLMDKRGRPLSHVSSEDLKKFYELSSSESIESEDEKLKIKKNKNRSIRKSLVKVSDETDLIPETEIIKTSVKTEPQKTSTKNFEDNKPLCKSVSYESEEVDEKSDESYEDSNKQLDFARGEGNIESTTTDDSSNGEEESENEDFDHKWGELDADAPSAQEITRRIAVCNMDWDRIEAKDLMVLFTSFKPGEGTVISVKIYPSEFGLKRMEKEKTHGPIELFGEKTNNNEENSEEMLERKYHREMVRQYQLNRLKYFYAVVECDSPETASKLYDDLDGKEYESSAAQLDLRFIPDSVIFEQEPKSMSESLPELSSYKPDCFTTTALKQAKVQLTWDETDPNRSKALWDAFTKAEDTDLQAYLASSSSENEEEDVPSKKPVVTNDFKGKETLNDQIAKYRSLLLEIDSKEKDKSQDVEMQITWEPGLKESAEDLVKRKKKEKELTPWEEYLNKRKKKKENVTKLSEKQQSTSEVTSEDQPFSDDEIPSDLDFESSYFKEELKSRDKVRKKKERRKKSNLEPENGESKAQLELLTMNEDDKKHHFSLKKLLKDNEVPKKIKKIKKKEEFKKKSVDDFQMNLEDLRFSALFTSHLYNVDPSDTHFKRTKGMDAVIQEKQKRRLEQDKEHQLVKPWNNKIAKTEISVWDSSVPLPHLVKSVKNKTQNFYSNRRKK